MCIMPTCTVLPVQKDTLYKAFFIFQNQKSNLSDWSSAWRWDFNSHLRKRSHKQGSPAARLGQPCDFQDS